jgi:hypothetical protein
VSLASTVACDDDKPLTVADSQSIASLSVFFPCYNDERTIGGLVRRAEAMLASLGIDHEIVVINDGSTDGSGEVLRGLLAEVPVLRIVDHGENRGYGAALRSGFAAATKEWVFYTDGDGQYDPREALRLIERASPAVDVVQGWKLERHDSWARAVVGRLYHHVVKAMFHLPVRDTDCDFRLIRRALLERADMRHSSGVICVEMLRELDQAGARFIEVPVHHYPRAFGRSQFFRLGSVVRSLSDLARLWLDLVVLRRRRPVA